MGGEEHEPKGGRRLVLNQVLCLSAAIAVLCESQRATPIIMLLLAK